MTFTGGVPSYSTVCLVLFVITASDLVWGHGMVLEPPNRASLWRFPEFSHLSPPANYEDNELFCGNFTTQYRVNGGKCGVCGDPYNEPVPRMHEDEGENYRGIIVRGYKSGQNMPVEVKLTASHLGYLEFRMCASDDKESHWKQECYDKHLLKIVNATSGKEQGTKYRIPVRGEGYYARYMLQLPKSLHCKHCVLQWHYQTGNRWGNCSDGSEAMGCGEQEVFRGCSDIMVYPEDTEEKNIRRNPNSKFGVFSPPQEAETTEKNYNEDEDANKRLEEENIVPTTTISSSSQNTSSFV